MYRFYVEKCVFRSAGVYEGTGENPCVARDRTASHPGLVRYSPTPSMPFSSTPIL